MKQLDQYEATLLEGWEEVYKKGQLTVWIMLSLKDGAKYMPEIKEFIEIATNGTLTADDKSMYRALRRYHDADLVTYQTEPGRGGPDRKLYSLTDTGEVVLARFVERNIVSVLYKPQIKALIERSTHEPVCNPDNR